MAYKIIEDYTPNYTAVPKVNDILHANVRFTQLYNVFYKITKVMPKSVELVQLDTQTITSDKYGQAGTEMPTTKVISKPITKRYTTDTQGIKVKFDKYTMLKAWNGLAKKFNCYD